MTAARATPVPFPFTLVSVPRTATPRAPSEPPAGSPPGAAYDVTMAKRKTRTKTRTKAGTKRRAAVLEEGVTAPADIDEAFAPRVVEDITEIDIDGERIVIGGPWGGAQVLNPTAALVWQFLDGSAPLGELIDDFSDATDTKRKVVRRDLLDFTRALGRSGLLVDVREPIELIEMEPAAAPTHLEPGEELDAFTLADLDGTDRSLHDFRGRQVFLVNWNPGCGYCVSIAPTLADLEHELAAAGVDLVFVTSGDVDANRALVEQSGLGAPVLLKRDDIEPFGPLGTPAATLLDEHGAVAMPLAMGALEVPAQAARLAGVELPSAPDATPDGASSDGAADDADSGIRYLPTAGGMCGPGAASGPTTEWAGTLALGLGDTHVGIRYNSASTRTLLEQLFVGAVVEDPSVPDNYSVSLTGGSGRSRDLELLVQGSRQHVRSRSRARVLAALLQHLSDDLRTSDGSLLRLAATPAVATDGSAILLPPGLIDAVGKLQPRLAKLGFTFADVPIALVDAASGELVVEPPSVAHDPAVLTDVDADVELGRSELPLVPPGRYPLRAWYLPVWDPDATNGTGDGDLSPALAVASTIGQCRTDDIPAAAADLATLVRAIPVRPISYDSAAGLVKALERS